MKRMNAGHKDELEHISHVQSEMDHASSTPHRERRSRPHRIEGKVTMTKLLSLTLMRLESIPTKRDVSTLPLQEFSESTHFTIFRHHLTDCQKKGSDLSILLWIYDLSYDMDL